VTFLYAADSPVTIYIYIYMLGTDKELNRNYENILWHVDPLIGNKHETNNYTMAVTRQRPINSNKGMAFSVWSMPRCYKQDSGRSVGQSVG
jgi:hypothetical protein